MPRPFRIPKRVHDSHEDGPGSDLSSYSAPPQKIFIYEEGREKPLAKEIRDYLDKTGAVTTSKLTSSTALNLLLQKQSLGHSKISASRIPSTLLVIIQENYGEL
jgi:hypothetical protein